ncbi:hypothetical protein BDC45DRAFT_463427 [Circinella umbellata]|nr:hypothetical protein BDC45DRAFT_463427 [Circinella umbellata]
MNRQNRNRQQQNQNNQEGDEQQQQPRQRNRIQGPTSALSSFLREHGIHIENRSRRRRQEEREERQQQQQQVPENTSASDNNNTTLPVESTSASSSTTGTPEPASTTTTSILYAPRQRRRQLNAAATQLIEAAQATCSSSSSSSLANKKKGKRKRPSSDSESDSDYDDGSETDSGPGSSSNRRPFRERRNEIVFCDKCKGRFARPVNSGNDIETENVCPPCTSGETPNKKRKKTAVRRRVNGVALGHNKVPSLQDTCIMVVARYIDDVEAFGEIGPANLDKLSKIISKNRKLTSHTARLFMEPTSRDLALYDCTNIDETGLSNISHFCAQLKSLKLIYCGQMTSKVLDIYQSHLKNLQSIELSGPYLVTKDAWIDFFKTVGKRLEVFKLSHSFRFNRECLEALAVHCPDLKELEFSRLNMMQNNWMEVIQNFKHLKTLKLAWPDPKQPKITSKSLVSFLNSSGQELVKLSFAGLTLVDDQVLLDGLLENCPKLKILNLRGCEGITSEGIQKLFNGWNQFLQDNEEKENEEHEGDHGIPVIQKKNQGLVRLNVSRILDLDDDALKAILIHSSKTLEKLNLHSLDKISARGLEMIAGKYPSDDGNTMSGMKACEKLKNVNCGFIRSMDDLVLKLLIEKCISLERIDVWGCNQLTSQITAAKTYIVGRELESAQQ